MNLNHDLCGRFDCGDMTTVITTRRCGGVGIWWCHLRIVNLYLLSYCYTSISIEHSQTIILNFVIHLFYFYHLSLFLSFMFDPFTKVIVYKKFLLFKVQQLLNIQIFSKN